LSSQLSAREAELDKLHEQLQQEVAAAAHKAAAQQAELSGERSLLSKQCASLDQERETFKAWLAERKEELARQHKVCGGRSVYDRRFMEGHCFRINNWLIRAHSHYRRDGASCFGTLHSCTAAAPVDSTMSHRASCTMTLQPPAANTAVEWCIHGCRSKDGNKVFAGLKRRRPVGIHRLYSPEPRVCLCACKQEREMALNELQHRLDRRAAELDEAKAANNAALTRR